MKKILLLAALVATAVSTFGQGVILFNNRVGTSPNFTVDAPITNGLTGLKIDGTDTSWKAALYGAAGSGQAESSLQMMSNPSTGESNVIFRTGGAAGYVNVGTAGARGLAGLGYTSAVTVQVRAWGGGYATYEQAVAAGNVAVGKSNLITVTTTTGPTDPAVPPLVGLQGFAVVIPEPSSIALGLLGLGAIALIRRRK